MGKRETHRALTRLFKSALDDSWLRHPHWMPHPFEISIRLMTSAGLPVSLLKIIQPLRRIVISTTMSDENYLGAYFGTRLEPTPGTEKEDWREDGWDGQPRMMLFPHIPPEWVILHEFGHYLDDTFLRALPFRDMNVFNEPCLDTYLELYWRMKEEYVVKQDEANALVAKIYGLEHAMLPDWWTKIPDDYVNQNAPTAYACLTWAEWVAEAFQLHVIHHNVLGKSFLAKRTPKTSAFMEFFITGKIFSKRTMTVEKLEHNYELLRAR